MITNAKRWNYSYQTTLNLSIYSDKGLMLKTSVKKLFTVPTSYQLSW